MARSYLGNAVVTSLQSGISAAATTLTLSSSTNWPTGAGIKPFVLLLTSTDALTKEKVLIQSRTGTILTVAAGGRGYDGTTAATFSAGAAARHVLDAASLQDHSDHIYDVVRDDHTQYLTTSRHVTTAHSWGGALPAPATPEAIGTVAAIGDDAGPSKADHIHRLGVASIDNTNLFVAGIVNAAALAADSVTAWAIAANSVNASELADNAVDTAALAADSVTTAKIAALAVTAAQLGSGSVTAIALGAGAVSQTALYADAKLKRAQAVKIPTAASHALTSYAPYPNDVGGALAVTFTKQHGATITALAVRVYASGFMVNRIQCQTDLGVKSGASTDHGTIAVRYFNTIDTHQTLAGELVASDLAAGSHTLTLQCKVNVGGGVTAFNADGNDRFLMVVEEVWI